jgi:hypothetical protein
VLAIVACGDDAPRVADAEDVTFEILYVGSNSTDELRGRERLEALPDQLLEAPVDVICLQGIGVAADRAKLKTALSRVFPVSLDLPSDDATKVDDPHDLGGGLPTVEAKPPCQGLEKPRDVALACLANPPCLNPSGSIVFERCLATDDCLTDALFAGDPQRRCRSCLVAHGRTGASLAEMKQRCGEESHPLVLHGDHGMLVLSKLPLRRPSLYVLPAESTRRAILSATMVTRAGREVDVFCASLGPTEPSALPSDPRTTEPYGGPYGDARDGWLRENELQIERLGEHVAARRGSRPAVVLGNFGAALEVQRRGSAVAPSTGAIGAKRLEDLFESGIAASYLPSCTVCAANPLVADPPSFLNRIYLAGLPASTARTSSRTYLGEVVRPAPPVFRERAPISMQYGFRSTIALPR